MSHAARHAAENTKLLILASNGVPHTAASPPPVGMLVSLNTACASLQASMIG